MSQNVTLDQFKQLLDDGLKQQLGDALKQQLDALKQQLNDALKQQLEDALNPVKEELRALSSKVDKLSETVKTLATNVEILRVKQLNSTATRSDVLLKVPLPDGSQPRGSYPGSLMELMVPGNEPLPDGQQNSWSMTKSKQLLVQYEDTNGAGSDSDNEHSQKSRATRLRVARHLGITNAQLNFAQLSL